jgi:hypothetical protein
MPLVLGYVTDTVVYVYPSTHAAESDRAGGTGFLVYVPFDDGDAAPRYVSAPKPLAEASGHFYVVTNKHNIIDPTDSSPLAEPAIVGRRKDQRRQPIPVRGDAWRTHSDGDDIAVAPIELPASIYYGAAFPSSGFVTHDDVSKFGIGPGVDVYYTGRFQPDADVPSITALRFGAISAMPVRVRHPRFNIDVESYLIEGRARAGYSGSPVVPGLVGHRSDAGGASVTLTYSDFLLGIHWGHIREWQKGELTLQSGLDISVNLPEGIMTVAPSWRILDILDSEDFVRQRGS